MNEKQTYIQRAADWANARGFSDIRANIEGYEKPISYGRQQDGESFIPDVTGKQFEQKSYFEVMIKTDQVTSIVSKLKLLSQMATVRGGQLYLMVPKGSLPFTKAMVAESRVTAEVINLL
ncbi:hypothetical protein GCM10028808_63200 [Spirosoma migulaei]